MTGIDLAVPPHNLIDMFEEQVRGFRRMLNNLLERNATLRETRNLLLPRLISSEISAEESVMQRRSSTM